MSLCSNTKDTWNCIYMHGNTVQIVPMHLLTSRQANYNDVLMFCLLQCHPSQIKIWIGSRDTFIYSITVHLFIIHAMSLCYRGIKPFMPRLGMFRSSDNMYMETINSLHTVLLYMKILFYLPQPFTNITITSPMTFYKTYKSLHV